MWQTQSNTNADTLRSRWVAETVSVVAISSGSFLLGDPLLAVRDEFFERHAELLARRFRQSLLRPHRVPHRPDLHTLDAVHSADAVRDRGRHARHERAPAGGQHQVYLDVTAGHTDVLDDAHVDDADAPVGATRVVHVA